MNINNDDRCQVTYALIDWIKNHSCDEREKPYLIQKNGKSYTLNEILKEIHNNTSLGKSFVTGVIKLAIELLIKNIKKLDNNDENKLEVL